LPPLWLLKSSDALLQEEVFGIDKASLDNGPENSNFIASKLTPFFP